MGRWFKPSLGSHLLNTHIGVFIVAQLLVQVVSVTNLAAGSTVVVPHTLESNGAAVAPTLVIADRATSIAVQSVSTTGVTFVNNGTATASANFRLERGWQPEVDASTVTSFLWNGGGGSSAAGTTTKVLALTTPVTGFCASSGAENIFTNGQVVLPANTLAAGSTITFRVGGLVNNAGGTTLQFRFYADSDGAAPFTGLLADTSALTPANNVPFWLQASCTIQGTGTQVGTAGITSGSYNSGAAGVNICFSTAVGSGASSPTTTVANTLTMTAQFLVGAAGNNITINTFEVYVAR